MVKLANEAAEQLADQGIQCTVLDPRTTSPLDEEAILASVRRTGRLVVVDEASPRCNVGTDISALVAEKAFDALKGPIRVVSPPHTPVPFSPALEVHYIPSVERIRDTAKSLVEGK
nr:transketolase C-terminal domain-containing protein [Halomonas sp. BC04]